MAWAVSVQNSMEMIGGHSPNQKVFGRQYNTTRNSFLYGRPVFAQLEVVIESRKLKELLENQELVKRTYQSTECKGLIMRALKEKIIEYAIEWAKNG